MHLALNGLDRLKLTGLVDTPEARPYWPARHGFLSLLHPEGGRVHPKKKGRREARRAPAKIPERVGGLHAGKGLGRWQKVGGKKRWGPGQVSPFAIRQASTCRGAPRAESPSWGRGFSGGHIPGGSGLLCSRTSPRPRPLTIGFPPGTDFWGGWVPPQNLNIRKKLAIQRDRV